jgi:hypothetical protein
LVLKNYRTITSTQTYSGTATTTTTDLPRDFLIQRILLNFNGVTTLSGTSTLVTDALLKCVKAIRIKAVGEGSSRTIFDVSGQDLYYMNGFDNGMGFELDNTDTSAAAHTQATGWVCDFRVNKLDPDDYSVAIPSYLLSTLQLEVEYDTSANGYGTNVSSQSFTLRITLIEGIPEASEDFSSNPLMTVLSKQVSGALIRRDFLCTETSAGVRASTEIADFSVKSGQIPLMSKIFFDANVNKDIMNYRTAEVWDGLALVEGYTMIDFANNRQPFVPTASGLKIDGLSTVGYNVGDLVFTADKNNASSILRRVQETVEG